MGGVTLVLYGVLLLGVAWGYRACQRLLARQPGGTVDTLLHHAPVLALPIVVLLVWSVGVVAVQASPGLLWQLPLWCDFYSMAMLWGALLLLFGFGFSLTVAVAFRTQHAQIWPGRGLTFHRSADPS